MSTDIRDALDRSFGTGPAHRPLELQLTAGRRALRRRRVLAATVAAGALAVAGSSYAVATSGPAEPRGVGVAVEPTPSSTPTPTADPVASAGSDAWAVEGWRDWVKVRYVGHDLQIRPGVTVHTHLDNPFHYESPYTSDGLDITFRGVRSWLLTEKTATGVSIAESEPSNGWASFETWVADQVAVNQGGPGAGSGWPEIMRLTGDGRVVAVPGAEVLHRTDDPQLGDSFAPPGTPTGAALVDIGGKPSTFFVVWRVVDGTLDVITTPPRDVDGATWDEMLTYARGQYASGEGLR